MALIKCIECGKEISDKAKNCVNCGCPIEEQPEAKENYNKLIYENYNKIKLSKNGKSAKKIFKKMYYLLILNNIECSKVSDINDWKEIQGWIANNINNMRKIKLEHVIKYSPNEETANNDYNEYQDFISHYAKLRSTLIKNSEKDDNKTEYIVQKNESEIRSSDKISSNKDSINSLPKCPNCNSIFIETISNFERIASVGMFGLASSKIGKTKKCKSCGYKW